MNPNESKSLAPMHEGADPGLSTFTEGENLYGDASLDPLAGAASMKKSHTGTILVAAVILIAVAGVVSMRKLAQVTAATGIDREIEQTIEQFISSLTPDGQRIPAGSETPTEIGPSEDVLSVLGTAYTEIQVPLSDVQRDPFVIEEVDEPVVDTTAVNQEDFSAQQERRWRELQDERREQLRSAGERFELKAIMGGSTPLAIVNGNTLTVGATIMSPEDDEFTVTRIDATTVEMVASAPELDVEVTVTLLLKR